MKTEQLESIIRELFEHDMELMRAKNHDYASDEDALDNFRDWGLQGFAVRIGDKYKRIKNILKKGGNAVQGEGLKDALLDIGVYSYLARAYMMERKDTMKFLRRKDTHELTGTELAQQEQEK